MSWHVYVTCGLCSAKTASFTDDDPDTAGKQADAAALRLGWVPLGPVRADDRHRAPSWVCKPCAGDVAGGFLEAGRRVQRPEPLPTLDSPAPPDGVHGIFTGLTQDEIAEIGPYGASIIPRPHG